MENTLLFLLKNVSRSYSHFFSKNTCELNIVLSRTVNILTTNELIKLMMLWTIGPWVATFCKSCLPLQNTLFHILTRKTPNGIMDIFFLNNDKSESCLSCTWNTYWSSSSSLPNMKAIHWRVKVTYNFEKRLTKRLTWDAARPPRHRYFKGQIFLKNPSKKDHIHLNN